MKINSRQTSIFTKILFTVHTRLELRPLDE